LPIRKNKRKYWTCGEAGIMKLNLKIEKNNKLVETLGSLDCVDLREDKVLDDEFEDNKNE